MYLFIDHPHNYWWSVQVMKLLIIQSSPASRHFLLLRSKYSPQHLFSNTLNICESWDFHGGCLHLHPKDEGSVVLWNVCISPQHYTASQLRRPRPEPSIYVLPLVWEIKFHSHKNQQGKKITVYYVLVFKFLNVWRGKVNTNDSETNGSKHFSNLIWSWFLRECHFQLSILFVRFILSFFFFPWLHSPA
jgi:hypothetical protein